MRREHLPGIIPALLAVSVFFGCATAPQPPEKVEIIKEVVTVVPSPPDTLLPLTASILRRLGDSGTALSQNIGNYQLLLFGRIILEREFTHSETAVEDGKAKFEDVHIRENITINDQTEGQALAISDVGGGEIVLAVSFENDDRLRLKFATDTGDTDSYFYLQHSSDPSIPVLGDEKGIVEYGGEIYKLRYSGDKQPYLLIKLSQTDTDRLNSRTAPGRRVY